MKIAFVTPLVETSAIGRVSVRIVADLIARGHEVEIIRSEAESVRDAPTHEVDARISLPHPDVVQRVEEEAHAIVLQVGDNYNFHAGIFPFLQSRRSVGIFHDFYIYNLFLGWLAAHGHGPEIHDDVVIDTYGEAAGEIARMARTGGASLTEIATQIPMTEWVARQCAGALAHSKFYRHRLDASCPGPVDTAHLPSQALDVPPYAKLRSAEDAAERLTLTTIGVVNPNKCVGEVIEAIGSSERLRKHVSYKVAGQIDDAERERLESIRRSCGDIDVSFLGRLSDDELVRLLADTDIIAAFRRPILEGASGSAIEGMLSGRPTLVADAGFYGELPDAYVVKVPAEVSPAHIARKLEYLLDNRDERIDIGVRARAWAGETFAVEPYSRTLVGLMTQVARFAPYEILAAYVGTRLNALGIRSGDPLVSRFGKAVADMAGLTERPE